MPLFDMQGSACCPQALSFHNRAFEDGHIVVRLAHGGAFICSRLRERKLIAWKAKAKATERKVIRAKDVMDEAHPCTCPMNSP